MSPQTNSFLTRTGVAYPVIMAPMFLVSNEEMIRSAIRSGIMGVFPSLNFRDEGQLEALITRLHEYKTSNPSFKGSFGVNLIVQGANPLYRQHLEICHRMKVPFYITSLGHPAEVISSAHSYGGIVYCDVTNRKHAQKCSEAGADGFIAVGAGAGGHAGPYPLQTLIPSLKRHFPGVPVIAAGGIADGRSMLAMLAAGATGASIGTRFIASHEAAVSHDYKQAILDADMEDIVMTTRISGTPCAIINTPYAQKLGYRQNAFERFLNRNPRTKKYFKMLVQYRGMKRLEKAVKPGNYQNLWCAGQSVELITGIKSCDEITADLMAELSAASRELSDAVSAFQ